MASSRLVTADLRDAFTPDVCFTGTGQVSPRVRLGPILKTISINLPVDTSSESASTLFEGCNHRWIYYGESTSLRRGQGEMAPQLGSKFQF